MTAPVVAEVAEEAPPRSGGPPRRPIWMWLGVAAGALVALVLAGVFALAVFHAREGRSVPKFAALSEHPDASLQGTVAYTTGENRCVRVVAAAGQPSRDVVCLGPLQLDPAKAVTEGKEMVAPQLVWRPDGRLEITGFLMQVGPDTKGKPPVYKAGWQKIVDVRTGTVEDVPSSELPAAPNRTTQPAVSPDGKRVSWTQNGATGQVKVKVTDATGSRTVLSAHGPGEYGYALYSVFWAPDGRWIAADDGRILVITPGNPSVTRVLVDGGGGWGEFPVFAVTGENVFTAAK